MIQMLRELFTLQGTIGRGSFATLGVILVIVKYNLDRLIISLSGSHAWAPYGEILFRGFIAPKDLTWPQQTLSISLLLSAIPFLWAGIALCLKRLRSLNAPLPLLLLFFVPYLNVIFFLLLCVWPSATVHEVDSHGPRPEGFLNRLIPQDKHGAAAFGILITVVIGLTLVYLSVDLLRLYGWGLFIGTPFIMGFISSIIYSFHSRKTGSECVSVALLSVILLSLVMLGFAIEGVVCILMAAPVGSVLAALGAYVGYSLQRSSARSITTLASAPLAIAALVIVEAKLEPIASTKIVESEIEVAADIERVWENVVQFPDIPHPTEWYFKTGIAYPVRATIEGKGPGAIRRCEFSTGAFVEPIEIWQEPSRLGFAVVSSPPPLEEWSPYRSISPPHLHGFFRATYGEFKLEKVGANKTRLRGITHYQQDLWPSWYWSTFSSWIISRIHDRVLDHIKSESEH